jgi:hypothetical protein
MTPGIKAWLPFLKLCKRLATQLLISAVEYTSLLGGGVS